MKSKTIALKVSVTTEDGEVLELGTIVTELDLELTARIDQGNNGRKLHVGRREAGDLYESGLRLVYARLRAALRAAE